MTSLHYYTFHCPEYWNGDIHTPEPEMVTCPLCIRKLRDTEHLPTPDQGQPCPSCDNGVILVGNRNELCPVCSGTGQVKIAPLQNWPKILNQLAIRFDARCPL
jgi:hypothetical protein